MDDGRTHHGLTAFICRRCRSPREGTRYPSPPGRGRRAPGGNDPSRRRAARACAHRPRPLAPADDLAAVVECSHIDLAVHGELPLSLRRLQVGKERSLRGRSEADPPAGSARVLRFSSPRRRRFATIIGAGLATAQSHHCGEATPARRGGWESSALPTSSIFETSLCRSRKRVLHRGRKSICRRASEHLTDCMLALLRRAESIGARSSRIRGPQQSSKGYSRHSREASESPPGAWS